MPGLKMICGPSGSGKTKMLIDAIRRDVREERKCYLLVPEQQAYTSERALLEALPENAGLYFSVVSFSSLADDVFRAYGGVTEVSADAGISALLMWDTVRTLAPTEENAGTHGRLIRYARNKRVDAALTALMLSTVSELRSGGITPDALERAAASEELDPVLAEKLSDLALISAGYHARLESAFGGDPADKLEKLADRLAHHKEFFRGCNVYVDSFTSFTAPEYEILAHVMKHAECLTVTLCADTFHSVRTHFRGIRETEERLAGCAGRAGLSQEEILRIPATVAGDAAKKPTELQILSDGIWDFSIRREDKLRIPPEERGAVRLLSANNVYEEAEAAALFICQQIQRGLRYREIAVIVRDTEVYRGVLNAAFERYGIPYFISERTDLASKPLSRLLLCALRAAAQGFRRADVIALLKTGLCGIEARDAAMFEEYCETWHITGKRFTGREVWSMNPDGATSETRSKRADLILKKANEVRAALIPPLERLAAELRATDTLRDYCEALYNYLIAMKIEERLECLAEKENEAGQVREESETLRLYDQLLRMLTTVCKCLPEARMDADEFITALSILLSNTDLGSVPGMQDCVMIGSAAMLRVENIRASLLLGLCEGEFPAAVSDDGIFNDAEKICLEGLRELGEFKVFFASRTEQRNAEELFYVYRAIAKPTEALLLCTVKKQTDGSSRAPSLAFQRARFLLRNEKTDKSAEEDLLRDFDAEAVRLARSGAPRTREEGEITGAPSEVKTLPLSQSRISLFSKCPYLHYLKYVLKLREPKDAMPTFADDGTFIHYVLEKFLQHHLDLTRLRSEDGTATGEAWEAELRGTVETLLSDYIRDFLGGSLTWLGENVVHQLSHLRHLALLLLRDTLEELRTGKFNPTAFEKGIGKEEGDSLPPVELSLSNGTTVLLTGRIDRIDTCTVTDSEGRKRQLVRVIDYKTGTHVFSPEDVSSGSDIQLVLYLLAYLSANADAEAYSAQYVYKETEHGVKSVTRSGFALSDETLGAIAPASEHKKTLPQSAKEIEALTVTLKETVSGIAARILAGEAKKTPSKDACKYCTIKGTCDRAYHGKE